MLLQKEVQKRRDEIAIDLEDRVSKKGTPPVPSESGDIRQLRAKGANGQPNGHQQNGSPVRRPEAMVE